MMTGLVQIYGNTVDCNVICGWPSWIWFLPTLTEREEYQKLTCWFVMTSSSIARIFQSSRFMMTGLVQIYKNNINCQLWMPLLDVISLNTDWEGRIPEIDLLIWRNTVRWARGMYIIIGLVSDHCPRLFLGAVSTVAESFRTSRN